MGLRRFRLKLWMLVVLVALVAIGIAAKRTLRWAVEQARSARQNVDMHKLEETLARGNIKATEEALARAERWLAQAEIIRRRKTDDRETMLFIENTTPFWRRSRIRLRAELDNWRGDLDYHSRMTRKWERAARYPFLPVAPD